jgi:hypothetical protein
MAPQNRPQNTDAPTDTGPSYPTPPATTGTTTYYGGNQTWAPPARWAIDPTTGKWVYAAHQGIVKSNGTITNYYNLTSDPESIWYSLPNTQKANIIDIFQSKGISARSVPQQLNAFSELLRQSNALGTEWLTTLGRFEKLPSYASSTGPSYKVANPADLRAVAKAIFRETIGREATEDEAGRFVQSYQRAQRAGTGSVSAPSAEIAAQDFARIAAPKEAAAYELLGYIGQFADAVQGVGR